MKSKVLLLDESAAPLGYDSNSTDITQPKPVVRKVVMARSKPSNSQGHESKPSARGTASKANKSAKQPDLTNFFKKPEKSEETLKEPEASTKPTVPFERKGPLSPVKRRQEPAPVASKSQEPVPVASKSQEPEVPPTDVPQPKASVALKARKVRNFRRLGSLIFPRFLSPTL